MPLPLIIGAAALATAAFGAKKGYDGYQKHSEADDIVNSAKARYEDKKSAFDQEEKRTLSALKSWKLAKAWVNSKPWLTNY